MTSQFSRNLIDTLLSSKQISALTGAGISAESGVPTFREAQTGLWANYDPMELATPTAFSANPHLVWQWYSWRRNLIREARPNPAHYALAALQEHHAGFSLITQNVDNLHQDAGVDDVVELHGNIFRTRCSKENRYVDNWGESDNLAPQCASCGAYLRPDVVWFSESLPANALKKAVEIAALSDVFLVIGTSALVHPAASLPLHARANGAIMVEINPQKTALSENADFILRGAAGEILPNLFAHILPKNQ